MSAVVEQRFTPWPFARAELELRVVLLDVDGHEPPSAGEQGELELPRSWQRARLSVVASCPQALLERLLEPDERRNPPANWLLALRCDATRLRRTLLVHDWTPRVVHEVVLDRDELAGEVELSAMLVRSAARALESGGHASERGAKLASASAWTLYADGRPRSSGQSLDVQWCSFADDPRIPQSARAGLYRVLLDCDPPLLLLNLDHAELRSVLDGKGTRGARARLRDLVFERIEGPVWTALLVHAAACLVADDELPFAWQRRVLDHWLPLLYPELDAPEARARLQHDYERLPELLFELDALMQVHGKLPELAHALLGDTEGG